MKHKQFLLFISLVLFLFPVTASGEWTWQNPLPQGNTLNGVWGSSGSDVFAVGDLGTILHYNGTAWSAMASGTANWLEGVWGSSGSDVFAVGQYGTILHYNGSIWSSMSIGTTNYLYDVWGSSSSDVFAVGSYGTILHYGETVPTTTVPPTTTTTTVSATLVSLVDFNAVPGNRSVILTWSTASEIDNAGFNLYRSEAEDGEYIKINDSLIPAQGSSTEGAVYEFVDKDVKNRRTYYYKLEDIDLSGVSTFHGPISATPRLMYRLFK